MPQRAPRITDEELAKANATLAEKYGCHWAAVSDDRPEEYVPRVQLARGVVDAAVADMFGRQRYMAGGCRKRITFPILSASPLEVDRNPRCLMDGIAFDSITLEIEYDAPESP